MSVSSLRLALGAVSAIAITGAALGAVAQTPAPAARAAPPAATAPGDVKVERRVIIRRDRDGRDGREGRGDRDGRRGGMAMQAPNPEARAERLRTLLQLQPGQEPALRAYLAALTPPAAPAVIQPGAATAPTAVERADRVADRAARMATVAKQRADATRSFYAALTPAQRKVFDSMRGGGGRMMHVRHMGGPGDGMRGMPMQPGRPG